MTDNFIADLKDSVKEAKLGGGEDGTMVTLYGEWNKEIWATFTFSMVRLRHLIADRLHRTGQIELYWAIAGRRTGDGIP